MLCYKTRDGSSSRLCNETLRLPRSVSPSPSNVPNENRQPDARPQIVAASVSEEGGLVRPLALLVDDSPPILKTTARFLEAVGFDVVQACSGDEALVPLASGQKFALLVTDYAMPGLNGVDLAIHAQEKLPELKALIMTGFPGADGFAKLPGSSAAILLKPFRRNELISRLHTLFDTAQIQAPA
jgi:CheY-like chemotaxis protein